MLRRYAHVSAIGLAGMSRAMSPEAMDGALPDAFATLAKLRPKFVHYKTCSTFDSSPGVGSIGRAIDIGARVFSNCFIPLVVGAPALGRYCVFGNLFARCGASEPYRLDRHPSMSRHPVTPMTEADLRIHLSRQTQRPVELIDVLTLEQGRDAVHSRLQEILPENGGVVLFDALSDAHLALIGEVLCDARNQEGKPLFVVGSSGVESALTQHWRAADATKSASAARSIGSVDRVIVVSGSCSPVTDQQIEWALKHGFVEIPLDAAGLLGNATLNALLDGLAAEVRAHLAAGRSVIIDTSRGPHDFRLAAAQQSVGPPDETTRRLGDILGRILRDALRGTAVQRVAVVGGDTSGHVAEALGIEALEMAGPLAPGVPLCVARSTDPAVEGVEIAFKGGQVGGEDFFDRLRQREPAPPKQQVW
jgi:3-oxoisoapionate kinase